MSKQSVAKYQALFEERLPIWISDPLVFIEEMWGITPQPLLPEYQQAAQILIEQQAWKDFRPEWFSKFQRGIHMTWQQWLILEAVKAAVNDKASKRISVASAHGIGKSCSISWIMLWYLFCHQLAQIGVTAPTSKQLKDILWKEASIWISRLHPFWGQYYEWQTEYIKHKDNPDHWFASARTARKDSTEALAGLHGQHVLMIADEASGVVNEVFDTMEGSLTEKDILVILISNPTRLSGYFYETHCKPEISKKWQTLQFDNISSPIVRDDYNQDIIDKHGKNSDEYRIRVLGQFPQEDAIDDKGYTALLRDSDIKDQDRPHLIDKHFWIQPAIMGIDPAGEGIDETRWVIRDQFKAAVVAKEKVSDKISIAAKTRTLMAINNILPENVYIDSFGVGAESAVEIASGGININPVNVGDQCKRESDRDTYLNKRARNYTKVKQAIHSGFKLVNDKSWKEELPNVRERRNEKGKVQIMPKRESKKLGYKSPNTADALMLTFEAELAHTGIHTYTKEERTQYPINQAVQTITKKSTDSIYNAI